MKTKLLAATVLSSLIALGACAPEPTRTEVRRVSPPGREIPLIDTNPSVEYVDSHVNFVTGGVGEDERAELEAVKGDYNLHVTQARTDGAFVEDINTVIRRKNGKEWTELLNVSAGPLLYVRLPEGSYVIESTRAGGELKKQNFTVSKAGKVKPISFTWKPL